MREMPTMRMMIKLLHIAVMIPSALSFRPLMLLTQSPRGMHTPYQTTRLFAVPRQQQKLVNETIEAVIEEQQQDLEKILAESSTDEPLSLATSTLDEEGDVEIGSLYPHGPRRRFFKSQKQADGEAPEDYALRLLSSELGVRQFVETFQSDNDDDETNMIPWHLLWERTLDTVEDVVLHIRRIPYDLGWQQDEDEAQQKKKKETILILGSGWAAHALLKVTDTSQFRVIVVSPTNHFVFTPMLASAAVGTVEYRSMTEAVRAANPLVDGFVEGSAQHVDLPNQVVTVQLNSLLDRVAPPGAPVVEIPYDRLVVAVGVKVADMAVPGADAHCLRLKTCEDARQLRENLGQAFEYASRLDVGPLLEGTSQEQLAQEKRRRVTFLIVGGGPTGVELAGELSDFVQDITKPRVGAYPKLQDFVRVVLVHGGGELLPQFEESMRQEAKRALESRGIEVRLNTKVVRVDEESVTLSIKQLNENGETVGEPVQEVLPVGLKVWCAGTAPVPFVQTLLDQLPESARGIGGRINVDRWMRADTGNPETFGSLLVLGDAASFQDGDNSYLPQTAQVAGQQGAYAARLLCRGYNLTATPPVLPAATNDDSALSQWLRFRGLESAAPFDFLNLGLLAYLGGGKALTQVELGDVSVFSYVGSVAFVLWRSVYLVKQVASRNRILITFDWVKSALFGRDVTRL